MDDTPELGDSPPRRGVAEEADAAVNPFARPGSAAPLPPQPDPSESASIPEPAAETPIPAPVFPRSAGEYSDSPGPAPRRSALSSTTPVEAGADAAPSVAWFDAHRQTLLKWAVGGVVGALVLVLMTFLVVRGTRTDDSPSASPSGNSASPSPSAEAATAEDLLTPADLAEVAPSTWTVTGTTYAAAEHQSRGACLSTEDTGANPTISLQRTLATSDADQSAALHRIDVFASQRAAEQVLTARIEALSNCSEIPTYIVGASQVTGLAEQSFQITVVFQDEKPQYHTVLLTRSGTAVQLLDVTRVGEPVAAASVPEALVRAQTALSERQGADAPADVAVADAPVPVADPAGWLIPSDLQRIRAGFGRWTMSSPGEVDGQMGCENMTLASEPGPTQRDQVTYVMTQDDEAPDTFGIDEMRFTFSDATASAAFAKKLGDALASCKDRVNTATVKENDAVSGTAGDVETSARIFTINQATSATESLTYQLIVSVAGEHATYSLITVTDDYRFSDEQLTELARRVGVRATQIS